VSIIHAIVLGLVQGVAEYLPISSDAHVTIVSWLFGWDDFGDDDSLRKAFQVALHIGTLLGACVYFRADIRRFIRAGLLDSKSNDGRLAWYLAFSAVPTAIVGALVTGTIESTSQELWLVAVMLILGALGLAWADGTPGKRDVDDLGTRDVVWLSLMQVLSLQSGVSRVGITITAGRLRGLTRDAATRFAFLMGLPVVFGAVVYKYFDIGRWEGVPTDMRPAFVVGVLVSSVTGYAAISWLFRLVRTRSFFAFVVYRLAVGALVLGLLAAGVSPP
jgi:undecaprenyl-diphosphatase